MFYSSFFRFNLLFNFISIFEHSSFFPTFNTFAFLFFLSVTMKFFVKFSIKAPSFLFREKGYVLEFFFYIYSFLFLFKLFKLKKTTLKFLVRFFYSSIFEFLFISSIIFYSFHSFIHIYLLMKLIRKVVMPLKFLVRFFNYEPF